MRLGVRFGLVTDRKLLKHLKLNYGNQWFDEDSKSYTGLIVQRFDGQVFKLDLGTNAGELQW